MPAPMSAFRAAKKVNRGWWTPGMAGANAKAAIFVLGVNEKSRRKERLWERSSFQSNETSYSVILLRVQRSAGVRLCLASRGII